MGVLVEGAELLKTVDSIPGLVAILAPPGEVVVGNRTLLEYTGRSLDRLKQWGTNDTVHPDDLPRVIQILSAALASGEPYEWEARIRRFDGVYRWFQTRAQPVRDAVGDIVHWFALLTDIDDLRRTEEALRRDEAFLAEGQRLSMTGSFVWRLDTDEITFSAELRRIFALEQVPVTLERILERVHPDDLPVVAGKIELARAGVVDHDYEVRLRMPDGSLKYLRTYAHATRDPEGHLEFTGAMQDVTQRRLSEFTLMTVRSELAHVSRVTTLSTLTASIAHEVNQPLSGIITNASACLRMLGADAPDVEGARETARRTIRDGQRAAEIVSRLRSLYSHKAATAEPVNLNDAVREVIALQRDDLQSDRVVVRTELAAHLPCVSGDRVQLQQVVLNLIRNASESMSAVADGRRELVVKTEREAGGVRLTVQDTGAGLPPDSAERLFSPFFTTKHEGMGMGLSVSRSIIESHRGRLWASANVPGPGVTFAFSLPTDTKV